MSGERVALRAGRACPEGKKGKAVEHGGLNGNKRLGDGKRV